MFAVLSLLIATAQASPSYPAEVESQLGMPCAPQCTLCHEGTPGTGTATSAFATAMRDRGLTGGTNMSALHAALQGMDADGVDSDGDGVTDIDELTVGDNPNGGDPFCSAGGQSTGPRYGCAAVPGTGWAPALLAFGLGAALRRRRG